MLRHSRKIVLTGLVLLLGFGVSALVALEKGSLPEFATTNVDGKRIVKADVLGKGPVLVAFWAVWCKPCRKELKAYSEMYEKYSKEGLQILAISIDGARGTAQVQKRVKEEKYPFTVLLDPDNEIQKRFGVESVPTMFLCDQTGKILYQHTGYQPGDEKKVEELLQVELAKPK